MIKNLLLIHAPDTDALVRRCDDLVRGTGVECRLTDMCMGNWREVELTGSNAEVELVVYRFVCGSATNAYVNTIMRDAEPVKLTESEFYEQTWREKYRMYQQMGSTTPITSAVRAADEHMRTLREQGNVPWVEE